MKIRNLKISQKAVSKLAACALAGALATTTLTGCGKKNMLNGTTLEKACVVVYEDGSKDIAISVDDCNESKYPHYRSITSGAFVCDETCTHTFAEGIVVHHFSIDHIEAIKLTDDEREKAVKSELDKNDIVGIINRNMEPVIKETDNKTK